MKKPSIEQVKRLKPGTWIRAQVGEEVRIGYITKQNRKFTVTGNKTGKNDDITVVMPSLNAKHPYIQWVQFNDVLEVL